ncbi:MAG TPA: 1-deoxy-D-xylulose-5-phosphate synthase, partial [Dehalococcoidales bacterium]|nr:1-deoxy-D-xylulose-5-phosphate synthase [Dehalococcoidales bacterium]
MSGILEKVNSLDDLKKLNYSQLSLLAQELRQEIISTISRNGGHLASSLGTVELTIALHRVLNSPQDKIVWDVGHQSYTHKILTGRKERFSTIRLTGGLSGFPSPVESPHDAFISGHAGNSISAALGMALARDLSKAKFQIAAVIGDGSLGNGMAFEAINHTGHSGTRLIVILNDNGMAISPTLGALARLFNQVRTDRRYERAKSRLKKLLSFFPMGKSAWRWSKSAKRGLKSVVLPNAFWEQLGFVYLGPLDGHNIPILESALIRARDFESGPVVLHVLTTKGKGYPAAEDNAVKFHGLSPRPLPADNGHSSYSQVFGQAISRMMRENENIVVISAAMLDGTGLAETAAEFPKRVIDTGICEQHAVTLAAGLATQGYLPVVAVYSTFLQRSYDQIIHDICLLNLPVVLAVDRAGIVGEDGATHQGAFDIAYLSSIPNLIVSAPMDEDELQHMLYTGLKAGRPMAIRYPRGCGEGVKLSPHFRLINIGQSQVVKEGREGVILALGSMVSQARAAADVLERQGVNVGVINARFAKPLDEATILKAARSSGRIMTVEEGILQGGFGSSVVAMLSQHEMTDLRVARLGLPDRFVEHGSAQQIREKYDLSSTGIVRRFQAAFPDLQLKQTGP